MLHLYLLLAECEVRTASYGPSFFPSFYGPSAKRLDHEKQERKKRGSIACRRDRANEANKMFIIWLCWLFRFWKRWSRARGPYGYLRTWNWPITAREISQPYNRSPYCTCKLPLTHRPHLNPPAFACICGNAIHYAWDGVFGSREARMCNKGFNEAFGEKLFNFMLFTFEYLVLCHPTPLCFTCIWRNAIHYAWDGVCGSREARMCNKGFNEAFGEKLFNFMLFSFGYLVIYHPIPYQTIVDLHKFLFLVSLV